MRINQHNADPKILQEASHLSGSLEVSELRQKREAKSGYIGKVQSKLEPADQENYSLGMQKTLKN